jgi:hypothetical protein
VYIYKKNTPMRTFYSSLVLVFICLLSLDLHAQGICNPAGNVIIYSNYDGGNMTINIDENIPDLRIGICSYEAINVTFTGTYVDNVTMVQYAGYNSGGTTAITGVDAGIIEILMYPPVTLFDVDGYPYMICAYECDTAYVPGGCNTVDQAVDYFLTEFGGSMRYSYFQYGVFTGTYAISDGGNCCVGASCTTTIDAGQDETICSGDSTLLDVAGGVTFAWSPTTGLSNAAISNPFASPTTTTTYYVTATDADGCVGIDSVTVFVNPLPIADIDVSVNTLTASGGTDYQWYQDGVLIPGATSTTYVVTESGTYSVLVTDANGCSAMSSNVTMIVNGISPYIASTTVHVYPNPTADIMHISSSLSLTDARYVIMNATGQIVDEGSLLMQDQVDVSLLPEGIYQILIMTDHAKGLGAFSILR